MNRPWMPLYIADYRADTAHLSASQHGAYLLLIMHYWQTGGLPIDDLPLSRIACMTPAEWKKTRPIIEPFFSDGWKHGRIEFELTQAARLSAAGKAGGRASVEARRQAKQERNPNDTINDRSTDVEALQPQLQSQERKQEQDAANAAVPNGKEPPDEDNQKREYYRRFQVVWGAKNSGAMATNLLKAKGSVPKARAAVESASETANPREYIGAIIRGKSEVARGERGVDWW